MSQLIITIIAVVLTAIAGAMGAYYLGDAFRQSQAKAFAATIAAQGQQITTALGSYANSHSGSWNGMTDLSILVSDGELGSIPLPPNDVYQTADTAGNWTLANLSNIPDNTATDFNGVYLPLASDTVGNLNSDVPILVCEEIARAVGGNSATPTNLSDPTNFLETTHSFDCVFDSSNTGNSGNTPIEGDYIYIYYASN